MRLRVIAALESWRVGAYGQVAKIFGVSPRPAGTWWRAFQGGGRQTLPAMVRQPRAGKGELPDNLARGTVSQAMPDCTPSDIGHTDVLWNRASVRVLMELACEVSTTEQGVGTSHMAASAQPHAATASHRSYRQQPQTVRAWPEEEYPVTAVRMEREQPGTVRARPEKNTERLELHLMPGHGPEPKTDKLLNTDLKHHVHTAHATFHRRQDPASPAPQTTPPASTAATAQPATSIRRASRKPTNSGSIAEHHMNLAVGIGEAWCLRHAVVFGDAEIMRPGCAASRGCSATPDVYVAIRTEVSHPQL